MSDHIFVTTHAFKTHMSRHIREMEEGQYKSVVVRRGRKTVGIFVLAGDLRKKKAS